ncbi:MAG: hypothetical protein JXB88_08435 [Spirochaetales bacterium]|nr:hypothetical protein [Spirochaetales bacterium]
MGKYEEIIKAKDLFSLEDKETIREIKRKINTYIKEWHPDISTQDKEIAGEKSISLIKAKEIIMEYIENYKISFDKEEIEKYLSPGEVWMNRFGNDHIWSDGGT